jgi:hypothetical protein
MNPRDDRRRSPERAGILDGVPERLPHPGAGYLKPYELTLGDRRLQAGMARPQAGPDDWWLGVFWITDDEGVVSFREVGPGAGPPPEPPLTRLGPSFANALSGMILEEDGRLCVRLTPLYPPEDQSRPWRCPLVIRAAFKWEPALVAGMTANKLAEQVLAGFASAVSALHRP